MEPFKNLLNEAIAHEIARALKRSDPKLDTRPFLRGIAAELEPLELKQRVVSLKARLQLILPEDPRRSFPVLTGALKRNEQDHEGLSGFPVWPLTRYVAEQGLGHFEPSMNALHAMTQVFTAEFDIRPFLIHHEEKTLARLMRWTEDESEHVRRLVSEGSRPLLPWGGNLPRFVQDPGGTWPLLERLKTDPSLYVRKSVANHINDHSKNHGDWVVQRLRAWKRDGEQAPELEWIIRHATRTLVKKCHPGALALHGISGEAVEVLRSRVLTPTVKLGDALDVELTLRNNSASDSPLMLDHELLLLKGSGRHQPKVFKGRKLTLKPGETRTVESRIPIRAVTVRTYYPGKQYWVAIVNGGKQPAREFQLKL